MLVYGAVLADAIARSALIGAVTAAIGAAGLMLLVLVLWRGGAEFLPASIVCLAAAYTVAVVVHGAPVDERAPLVGAGLLLCCELAVWSLDERPAIAAERAPVRTRATALAALTGGGLAASALVVAVSAASVGRGLVWTVAGAAAAVLAVGLAVRLSHRDR